MTQEEQALCENVRRTRESLMGATAASPPYRGCSGETKAAKHTPGPWRIFQTKGEPPFYVIGIGKESGEGITDGNVGLGVWDADSPEALANARLIAASPTMLKGLKTARLALKLVAAWRKDCAMTDAIAEVEQAIAAAEAR